VNRIFEFLDARSLVALELYRTSEIDLELHQRFDTFMRRRNPHDAVLRYLTLELLMFNSHEDLPSLLSAIPELKDLTQLSMRRIDFGGPEEDIFKALQTLPLPKYVELAD
jgi:hypothetical protein